MRLAGQLEFVDIGSGSWKLITDNQVYELIDPKPRDSHLWNKFVCLADDLVVITGVERDVATTGMCGIPFIVEAVEAL